MSKKNIRKTYFIDKDFQKRFITKFCLLVVLSSLLVGIGIFFFSRGSTTVAIENTQVTVKRTSDFIMPVIVSTLVIVTVFSALLMIFLSLFVSHKISGPLYRLKNEVEAFKKGDLTRTFNIRGDDQVQGLAVSLGEMGTAIRQKHQNLNEKWNSLKDQLKENDLSLSQDKKEQAYGLLEEISLILNSFKL